MSESMSESMEFEPRRYVILQGATRKHIELLHFANIAVFGDLHRYVDNPGALYRHLEQTIARLLQFEGVTLNRPLVEGWLFQAQGQLPGTPITPPPLDE